jgi:hypothetical protein
MVDDQLRWDEQIDNISNKVSQGIGMLRRAKQFVKRETLQFLYNSMVQPYFEYCSLVWGNCMRRIPEGKTAETSGQQGPSLQVILMIYVQNIF